MRRRRPTRSVRTPATAGLPAQRSDPHVTDSFAPLELRPTEELEHLSLEDSLLDRVREQWRCGDWEALASLSAEEINPHPQRARLAIMVASAHLAQGRRGQTLLYARLARQWGCDERLLGRVLAAGVHNTLGRVAAVDGLHGDKARHHFEQAVVPGVSRQALPRVAGLRAKVQLEQLGQRGRALLTGEGMHAQRASAGGLRAVQSPVAGAAELPAEALEDWAMRLRSGSSGWRSAALQEVAVWLQRRTGAASPREMAVTDLRRGDLHLLVVHMAGDYIPKKIASEQNFYEHRFLELLEFFHLPDGLVVDVGANIGNHTLYFAQVMQAQVLAVEPEPHNATCLMLNIATNRLTQRVRVVRQAVGERPGVARLQMNVEANFGSFSARPEANPSRTAVQDDLAVDVPVTTLDELLTGALERQPLSILKFDIEGMELEALRGATAVLERARPLVAVECFSRQQLTTIESELSTYGYFPVEFENATPTFVFVSRHNTFHMERLADRLREGLIARAGQRKGFD